MVFSRDGFFTAEIASIVYTCTYNYIHIWTVGRIVVEVWEKDKTDIVSHNVSHFEKKKSLTI